MLSQEYARLNNKWLRQFYASTLLDQVAIYSLATKHLD